MKATLLSCLALGFAVLPGIVWAAESDDEAAAIRKRIESYVEAYNNHDATALSEFWSETAVYVNRETGERIEGRPAIAAMFKTMFEGDSTSKLTVTVDVLRLITPEVAIEDGTAEIVSGNEEPLKSTYTAVHVKKEGNWFLDSVRETDTPAPPASASESSQLDELAWMVGEWLDQDEESTIRTKWQWTKNKHFLTSSFNVIVGDDVELEGTQVIGWDAANGQIRSWVFDSEGGFGEGVWRRAGNQWTVESTQTLSDGSQASSINVYNLIDDKTFTFKSVDRVIDGEAQPDIEEVAVHRQ